MEEIIKVDNIIHRYRSVNVLEKLNFSVKKGRIFGLLGKNGAGKTTAINIMMGFLQPLGGRCEIFGEPSHKISPETRTRIGLIHENHLQYDFMNISQAEKFYSSFYSKWDYEIFNSLTGKLGLDKKHKNSKMSFGQRSQVKLALILAQKPELMILDDYSTGLDAGYRRLFLEYISEYAREYETTVFVTSHIVQDLEKVVDDIVILDRGKTLISSTLEDFTGSFVKYRLKNFHGDVDISRDNIIVNSERFGRDLFVYSFESPETVMYHLKKKGVEGIVLEAGQMSLEDAFIGLTGKY
ncbi:MAG: ABC transporter ATP-binding protein [Desulfobacteraceae bacterium]